MGKQIQRVVFAMGLVAAMGFGAVQALAAPHQARAAGTCTPEEEFACLDYCVRSGGNGASCSFGQCTCY